MSHFVGDAVQLRELCDRFHNRRRIDEIGEAGGSLFLDAIEATGGAVALKGSDVAGKPGVGKEVGGLVECQGIICRGLARCVVLVLSLVVGHCRQYTPARRTSRRCPQCPVVGDDRNIRWGISESRPQQNVKKCSHGDLCGDLNPPFRL